MTKTYFYPDEGSGAQEIELNEGESLLDGLLRSGLDITYGCKSGVCQSCILRSSDPIPAQAQQGLKQTQIEQNLFLSCCCFPADGFRASSANLDSGFAQAKVIEKEALSETVFRLRLKSDLDYRPGQFITIWNQNNVARSYSIASVPEEEGFIECHIKRIQHGAFSEWAWNYLKENDELRIQGPLGQCFYTKGQPHQNILLCGIGTGLAPLYGIARDALNKGHTGKLSLFIGGMQASRFYLIEALADLQDQYENFQVVFVAQKIDNPTLPRKLTVVEGDIYSYVKETCPSLKDSKVFLCGAETFVRKMKKQCFLSGASMKDIAADPFIAFGG